MKKLMMIVATTVILLCIFAATNRSNAESIKTIYLNNGGGYSQPEILNMVQKFFDSHLKNTSK